MGVTWSQRPPVTPLLSTSVTLGQCNKLLPTYGRRAARCTIFPSCEHECNIKEKSISAHNTRYYYDTSTSSQYFSSSCPPLPLHSSSICLWMKNEVIPKIRWLGALQGGGLWIPTQEKHHSSLLESDTVICAEHWIEGWIEDLSGRHKGSIDQNYPSWPAQSKKKNKDEYISIVCVLETGLWLHFHPFLRNNSHRVWDETQDIRHGRQDGR